MWMCGVFVVVDWSVGTLVVVIIDSRGVFFLFFSSLMCRMECLGDLSLLSGPFCFLILSLLIKIFLSHLTSLFATNYSKLAFRFSFGRGSPFFSFLISYQSLIVHSTNLLFIHASLDLPYLVSPLSPFKLDFISIFNGFHPPLSAVFL